MEITGELLETLSKGVQLINEQHRRIFDFTTDLFAHCVGEEDVENEYFGATIGDAAELVVTHFKTEEALMNRTDFPFYEYAEHKKEHDEFVLSVTNYMADFQKTGNINLLMFASYAKWWVINHIKRHDRKYIIYFNEITEDHDIMKMRS
jgi:hemerythrin-like metal-binding protein